MLHSILVILKVTGTVVGLLLLFLLCVGIALFFVPVKYRVSAIKQENKLESNMDFGWLFRMVSAAVSIRAGERISVTVRLFGFRLPVFSKKESKPESGRERGGGNPPPDGGDAIPGADTKDGGKGAGTSGRGKSPGKKRKAAESPGKKQKAAESPGKKQKAAGRKQTVRLREKWIRTWKRLSLLSKKPALLFQMAEEYAVREVFGNLTGEVLCLLNHYRPRQIRGYLRFGTGNPAVTGQLTGIIYLFLPARADQFTLIPDFYEPVFETEIICTGRIRAVHLVRFAFHAFRDKKLRRLVHKVLDR